MHAFRMIRRFSCLLVIVCPVAGAGAEPLELVPAVVHEVRGQHEGGRQFVSWRTGWEAASAGFMLLRFDRGRYRRTHEGWIAPPWGAPAGADYTVEDMRASSGATGRYLIVERDRVGGRHLHGPYSINFLEPLAPALALRTPQALSGAPLVTAVARALPNFEENPPPAPRRDVLPGDPSSTIAKARVRTAGLHRLTASALAAALGETESKVLTFIDRGLIAVRSQGQEVAWFTTSAADEILFYATGIDSRYTLDNIYWIVLGEAQTVAASVDAGAAGAEPGGYFQDSFHAEEDLIPAISATMDATVDFWYWVGVRAESSTQNVAAFEMPAVELAPVAETAQLSVRLAGATDSTGYYFHHALLRVNGVTVGELEWGGFEVVEGSYSFDASILEADNTVEIEAVLDSGSFGSVFFVDSLDLSYPRLYRLAGEQLMLRGDGNPTVTVEGLASADVIVLNLENAARPVLCDQLLIEPDGDGYTVSFTPATADAAHLVTTLSAARAVGELEADVAYSDPWQALAGHDYVVIAPELLRGPVQRLLDYRAAGGLDPYLIVLEDLYDHYSHGIADPWAVREFLLWANDNWALPPRYVFLVGSGTFDPKNFWGVGDNLITPVLTATPYGLAAADNLLADIDGDGLADFALGRLPVQTESAFDAYIDKLIAFEQATEPWIDEAMMLADNPDVAGDFTAQSEQAAEHLPAAMAVREIYLEEQNVSAARAEMFASWGAGQRIVNYIGHGGIDVLADEALLTGADMPALEGTGRAAVVSALTCVVGRFELPGWDALSESLLAAENGGAVTVWSPTSPSFSGSALDLNELYFDALSVPGTRVGDAVLSALEQSDPSTQDFLLVTYTLLGDPAVQVR